MAALAEEYGWLFLTSFLAATVLPLSSEAVLALVVGSRHAVLLPVVVATLGNYGGAAVTYWLARRAGQWFSPRRAGTVRQARALALLHGIGQPVLVFSWVPLLGDALVVAAGAIGTPFGRFSLWVIIGKAARYAVVAWVIHASITAMRVG